MIAIQPQGDSIPVCGKSFLTTASAIHASRQSILISELPIQSSRRMIVARSPPLGLSLQRGRIGMQGGRGVSFPPSMHCTHLDLNCGKGNPACLDLPNVDPGCGHVETHHLNLPFRDSEISICVAQHGNDDSSSDDVCETAFEDLRCRRRKNDTSIADTALLTG